MKCLAHVSMILGEMEAQMKKNSDGEFTIGWIMHTFYFLSFEAVFGFSIKNFALRIYGVALQKHQWHNVFQGRSMDPLGV